MKEKVHTSPSNLFLAQPKLLLLIFIFSLFGLFVLQAQNSNASDTGNENANENATVEGGMVSTMDGSDYAEACIGDEVEDIVHFMVEGASGRLKQWVITDDEDNILYLPEEPWFDFNNEEEEGTVRVYHLSYNGMKPLVQPFWHKHISNLLEDLRGKYDISDNYIEVKLIQQPEGGEASLADGATEIEICAGDGNSDLFEVNVTGASGGAQVSMIWVVTETNADIVMTTTDTTFDFEADGEGTYLIWHLSYAENVSLEGVTNANDLMGCFDLSNPITVIRNGVNAGSIAIANDGGTAIEICAGDGNSDAFDVEVMGDLLGDNMGWIITDNAEDPKILAVPDGPPFDLEGAGGGVCLIWHIAYEDGLQGMMASTEAEDYFVSGLEGCFSLSNAIEVTRIGVNGGTLTAGDDNSFSFTVGDGTADTIEDGAITLEGNMGTNSAWIVTNEDGTIILGLPANYTDVDFDGAGEGVCKLWHMSYEDGLEGLDPPTEGDHLMSSLVGCFSLSNAITINRTVASTSKVALYPNPTKSSVSVDLTNFSGDNINISLYNLKSLRFYNQNMSFNGLSRAKYLNVSDFESGLYFVKVTNLETGVSAVKRLVIN
ncbi:T9SS type A sorting domain-containing protein [Aestuariivivens insulae]|uniref:T9SS type A sorting domain-containing protein n=1 Tax=Aestuariivivens insulae TaxID=1621988 RepID=UPI001F592576|nr:T9SS type A sorting domain-containing protein [Aestuariivivens insulae]